MKIRNSPVVRVKLEPLQKSRIMMMRREMISAPLPLIELPAETRTAKTGWSSRSEALPVFRPIESHAALNPEPVLHEPIPSVDNNTADDDTWERFVVYEYPRRREEDEIPTGSLEFSSYFESGNLLRADRIITSSSDNQGMFDLVENRELNYHTLVYELVVQPDLNNSSYAQWFYFRLENGQPGVSYHFSIINLAKTSALFGLGLQPVVYSTIEARESKKGNYYVLKTIKSIQFSKAGFMIATRYRIDPRSRLQKAVAGVHYRLVTNSSMLKIQYILLVYHLTPTQVRLSMQFDPTDSHDGRLNGLSGCPTRR